MVMFSMKNAKDLEHLIFLNKFHILMSLVEILVA